MKTKADQILYTNQTIDTYNEYNALTTEWIDTAVGCALLTTKGIHFSGEKLREYFNSQADYLNSVLTRYRADSSQKYDSRRKRMTAADKNDLDLECRDFTDQKLREWLADLGFSDPQMVRLCAPMQSDWKRIEDGQNELRRLNWWKDNGWVIVRMYVASSLLNLREISADGGMPRFGPKRMEWLYDIIVKAMQEYYSLFFKASKDSNNRIRDRLAAGHKIMRDAGIEFKLMTVKGMDEVCQADAPKAPEKPSGEPLPDSYSKILEEAKRNMGERRLGNV